MPWSIYVFWINIFLNISFVKNLRRDSNLLCPTDENWRIFLHKRLSTSKRYLFPYIFIERTLHSCFVLDNQPVPQLNTQSDLPVWSYAIKSPHSASVRELTQSIIYQLNLLLCVVTSRRTPYYESIGIYSLFPWCYYMARWDHTQN